MLRKSIVFTSAILLVIIASSTIASAWLLTRTTEKRTSQYYVGTNNLYSVDEGWIRSNKKDGIETFYRYEKIGTDKFEVEVKIANYRSKAVKVSVQVQYKS